MADLIFKISPNIVMGTYTASRVGQFAKDWGKRYMVIMDPVLKESGNTNCILESLAARKVEYFVFAMLCVFQNKGQPFWCIVALFLE